MNNNPNVIFSANWASDFNPVAYCSIHALVEEQDGVITGQITISGMNIPETTFLTTGNEVGKIYQIISTKFLEWCNESPVEEEED